MITTNQIPTTAKTAFFDMDGTVLAPLFPSNGAIVTGFKRDNWIRYCTERQKDAYNCCMPVQPVIEYARRLRRHGWDARILTAVCSDGERKAKLAWIKKAGCDAIFTQVHFVDSAKDKLPFLEDFRHESNLPAKGVMLVEDDLLTLLDAAAAGFRTVHVSHITAGSQTILTNL